MTVLEGESLVNDASALVVLRTAVVAITAAAGTDFSFGDTVLDFGWSVIGAALIGMAVGWATALLRQRLDDPVLNTTISFAVPFLAYFPAEQAQASGVLAVVMAGLLTGALGSKRFSARDRQTQATTWTTISFILESAVFLAMGYQLRQADVEFEEREPITGRGYAVLGWAGMRGVVTVAAVQTIPAGARHVDTVDGEPLDPELVSTMKERIVPRLVSGTRELRETRADAHEQMMIVQRRYLDAMRDALGSERSIGAYSSEAYRQVESLLDSVEQRFKAS
jgi:NhaP-type Na+/H+ or K+/H+ antiporter